ncbi:MAG TPA: VLRF1 family aeRF1-type release factor, partial [Actinopolymorphaceae bacterium]
MELDRSSLRKLAEFSDDAGVLSVFVTIDPREETRPNPPSRLRTRTALQRILDEEKDKDRRKLLEARFRELAPAIDRVLDPREPGLGRAFFAPITTDNPAWNGGSDGQLIELQLPLVDLVTVESTPYIRPLLEAAQVGAPVGLLAVSRDGVRQVDYRYGLARELERLEIDVDSEPWREYKGPAPSHPQLGQQMSTARDQFDHRREEHVLRSLLGLVPTVTATADKLGWQLLLAAGEPRLVGALIQELPSDGRKVIASQQIVDDKHTASVFAAAVDEELRAARVERAFELSVRAKDAALGEGLGTLGLADTLDALQDGKVGHLLLASARDWRGARGDDGRLVPAAPESEADEPRLGERMIELAIRFDAEVTMLPASVTE